MPLVKPGIVAGSILVFIPSLGAYVTPRVLGGGKNMMLGNLIELQFGQGRNWPLGAALSMTLMVIVMVALLVYVRNAGRSGAPAWLSASARFDVRRQPGFTTIAMICFFAALPADRDAGRLLLQRRRPRSRSGKASRCAGSTRPGTTARSSRPRSARLQIAIDRGASSRRSPPPWRRSPRPGPTPFRGLTVKYAFINQPLMVPEIVTAVALLIFFSRIKICDRL